LSLKTKIDGLSVDWPQNHWDSFSSVLALKPMTTVCEWFDIKIIWTVFGGLASKSAATVFSGLVSNPAVTVFSDLVSKPVTTFFSCLASKLVATISPGLTSKLAVGFLVEPQN
jgi:hypothetical protein